MPLGPASRPGRETGPRDRAKLRLVRAVCVACGEKINRWGTLLGDAYLRTGSRVLETSAEVAAPASAPPYRSCVLRRGDYLFLVVKKGTLPEKAQISSMATAHGPKAVLVVVLGLSGHHSVVCSDPGHRFFGWEFRLGTPLRTAFTLVS